MCTPTHEALYARTHVCKHVCIHKPVGKLADRIDETGQDIEMLKRDRGITEAHKEVHHTRDVDWSGGV